MVDEGLQRVETTYRRIGRRWAWTLLSLAGFQGWEPVLRRRAVSGLQLRPGGAVLDVGCGRGANFPYLVRAVGAGGRIVGVDYSPTMLAGAQALVRRKGWPNVEVVQADAAEMQFGREFDGALCTNAMSVIPRWQEALRRMVAAVRPGGRVVVLDGRLSGGLMRIGRPYARLFARVVAADLSRDIPGECRKLLTDVREERPVFGNHFIVSGGSAGTEE